MYLFLSYLPNNKIFFPANFTRLVSISVLCSFAKIGKDKLNALKEHEIRFQLFRAT